MPTSLKDEAAIAGIGQTPYTKNSGVSELTLACQAVHNAIEDAGVDPKQVDGLFTYLMDSSDEVEVARAVGLGDLTFFSQINYGGGAAVGLIHQAAMAVATGSAKYVVVYRALNGRSGQRMGQGVYGDIITSDLVHWSWYMPFGLVTPASWIALQAQLYMHHYGATSEHFAQVALSQRAHAQNNPDAAMYGKPMTLDDYMNSRMICEPLRLFDCCLETDAAVALILTSTERALDLRQIPVTISGAMWGSGHTLFSNRRPDLATSGVAAASQRLWAQAGLGPDEVDVAEIYDAFTPLVLIEMEDFGFCKKGEAGAFVRAGETGLGGSLPVNTHGGHLSEGYVHGLNHCAEAVHQLRGECGERQVEGAEVALTTGQGGYVMGNSSAVVLRRGT